MRCFNIYCLQHVDNGGGHKPASWNTTNCFMFEVDPYDDKDNPGGFSIEECPAMLRFLSRQTHLINYAYLKAGDSFFLPNKKHVRNCNTVYRNVRKLGMNAVLKKTVIDGTHGILVTIQSSK